MNTESAVPTNGDIPAARVRLASLDAYRGFAMVLMALELLRLSQVADYYSGNSIWQFLGRQQSHVDWTGCTLHDLIQPSFSFMVGVALPFSLAKRRSFGQSNAILWVHALWRSLVLVLLGVFLRSMHSAQTNWTFEDTLSQIGLGYPFLFALGWLGRKAAWIALGAILVGYWAFFAFWPLPPVDFDYQLYNGRAWFEGFYAHWNQNGNAAWAFDRWFLNLFPREEPFMGNGGGYSTLSFIPTLATMILGLVAGRWLKDQVVGQEQPKAPSGIGVTTKLVIAGTISLALGWSLDRLGICPSVKKIWTPAWVLFSGGWCFLLMAMFYQVADGWGFRRLLFPLIVVGLNPIAMYVLVDGLGGFIRESLDIHVGEAWFSAWGAQLSTLFYGGIIFIVLWLILLWMHWRRIYLKI